MTLEKRCCMVSLLLQKKHLLSPFHFLLIKLSLVKRTPFCRYHNKIFIFKGSHNFHTMFLSVILFSCIKSVYKDLAVKLWILVSPHTKESLASVKVTFSTLDTKSSHEFNLSPTRREIQWSWSKDTSNRLVFPPHNSVQRGVLLHQRFITQPAILPEPSLLPILNQKFSSFKKMLFYLH